MVQKSYWRLILPFGSREPRYDAKDDDEHKPNDQAPAREEQLS